MAKNKEQKEDPRTMKLVWDLTQKHKQSIHRMIKQFEYCINDAPEDVITDLILKISKRPYEKVKSIGRNYILKSLKNLLIDKQRNYKTRIAKTQPDEIDDDRTPSRIPIQDTRLEIEDILTVIENELRERDYDIMKKAADGYSIEEIAETHNITTDNVHQIKTRSKKKLKDVPLIKEARQKYEGQYLRKKNRYSNYTTQPQAKNNQS